MSVINTTKENKIILILLLSTIVLSVIQGLGYNLTALYIEFPPSSQKWYQNYKEHNYLKYGYILFLIIGVLKHLLLINTFVVTLYFNIKEKKLEKNKLLNLLIKYFIIFIIPMISILLIKFLIIEDINDLINVINLFVGGTKSFIAILAIYIGYNLYKINIEKIIKIIDILLILNAVIASIQIVPTIGTCSEIVCIRATGTFFEPNTFAAFAIIRLLIQSEKSSFIYLIVLYCILLSGSRTILITYIVILLTCLNKNDIKLYLNLVLSLFLLLVIIFSRKFNSLMERLSNFTSIDLNKILLGSGFGEGTQAIHLISNHIINSKNTLLQSDTQFLVFIHQGGIFFLIGIMIIMWKIYINVNNKNEIIRFMIVMLIPSVGIISLETWPFNIILMMYLGIILKYETIDK